VAVGDKTADETFKDVEVVFESYMHLVDLSQKFVEFDMDKSKTIDCTELRGLFKACGIVMEDKDVCRIKAQYDEDNSGSLDFDEFITMGRKELRIAKNLAVYEASFKRVMFTESRQLFTVSRQLFTE
jgi:hypothetical protein